MRRLFALAVLLISGCYRPPTAPLPASFHTARSAKEVTQIAAVALANAGFRVTQIDSAGLALEANRTATHNGNENYVTCQFPRGSDAAANRETTFKISFRVTPGANGSDVTVGGNVRTWYPGYEGTAMQTAPNDTDCVSNGTMERQLQSILQ